MSEVYGLPETSGRTGQNADVAELARRVSRALARIAVLSGDDGESAALGHASRVLEKAAGEIDRLRAIIKLDDHRRKGRG